MQKRNFHLPRFGCLKNLYFGTTTDTKNAPPYHGYQIEILMFYGIKLMAGMDIA